MEKLLKFNYRIAVISIITIVSLNLVKYGFTYRGVLTVVLALVLGAGGTTFIYFSKMSLEKKAVSINILFGTSSILYGIVSGGSSNAFFVFFLDIAVTTMYFDSRIMKKTNYPLCVIAVIVNIFWPEAIGGIGASRSSSITKTVFFIVATIISVKSTQRGEMVNVDAKEALRQVEENAEKSKKIAKELNTTVVDSTESVSVLVEQIYKVEDASTGMSDELEEMTKGISNVNNSISKASKVVNLNSQISDKLREGYEDIADTVKIANENIGNVRNTMEVMEQAISDAAQVSDDLSTQMEEIHSMLEEINNIASQTNLLSLNASIEAARAGEHGKGFAVVAEEIRKLSDESSNASGKIKNIIDALTERVNEMSYRIENGVKTSKRGYEEMDKVNGILERITEKTTEFEDIILEENSMVSNLDNEFNIIASEMINLYSFSEKNQEKLYSIQTSMREQNESARNLKDKMSGVNILADELVR